NLENHQSGELSDLATFRLLAGVRWQVFRNSMNSGLKRLETAVRVITWLLGTSTVLLCSILFGALGFYVSVAKPFVLGIMLWVLFLLWQIIPLVLQGSVRALAFSDLGGYPVRFRLFY